MNCGASCNAPAGKRQSSYVDHCPGGVSTCCVTGITGHLRRPRGGEGEENMLGVILALLLLPFGPLAPACVAGDCCDGSRLETCCVERSLRPVGTYFSANVCNAGLDVTRPTSIEWWRPRPTTASRNVYSRCRPSRRWRIPLVGRLASSRQRAKRLAAHEAPHPCSCLGRAVPGDGWDAAVGDPVRNALAGRGALIRICQLMRRDRRKVSA